MDIYFRNNSDSRVGFIIGTDIKDNSGRRVGYIEGGNIKDNSGSRIGYMEGNNFKDNYGNRVGFIEGNNIKNTYGARVGYPETSASALEMCAAALLLFGLEAPRQTTHTPSYSRGSSSDDGGWFAVIAGVLLIIWGILKGFVLGIVHYFSDAFDFKGKATRKEWWVKCLLGLLFIFIIELILLAVLASRNSLNIISFSIASGVFLLLMIPIVAVSIRRMHDIGKRGWWILIPLVGFIMCGFFPGKTVNNPYV